MRTFCPFTRICPAVEVDTRITPQSKWVVAPLVEFLLHADLLPVHSHCLALEVDARPSHVEFLFHADLRFCGVFSDGKCLCLLPTGEQRPFFLLVAVSVGFETAGPPSLILADNTRPRARCTCLMRFDLPPLTIVMDGYGFRGGA